MKKTIYFMLVLCGAIACAKEEEKLPQGATMASGKIFYKDRFATDSSKLVPLSYTDIFVRLPEAADGNYFYKIRSDKEGNFYLDIPVRPVVLYIKTSLKVVSDTAVFYGSFSLSEPKPPGLQLVAEFDASSQRAFVMEIKDEEGGALPNGTVYLYNSLSLSILNNSAFAVATFTTDSYGKAFSTKLAAGTYYANSYKISDTITYQRLSKQVVIPANGVVNDTMHLRRSTIKFVNGFTITVKDSLGGLIPTASVYLYNSQVLAASNDSTAAMKIFRTDNNGKVTWENLPAGNYYLNATKRADSIIYRRLSKQLIMPATGMVTDTMVVRRAAG